MKRVLIVEDEKMIRQGVHLMVARSEVEVEEILESRNGEEALEILNNQPVDVMITDIRMPKMDGIALVKKTSEMDNPPKIVVLSGYDDFNYAVDVLKNGARDYILKPIERQKINGILLKMEEEIKKESEEKFLQEQMKRQQMKQLLLTAGQENPDLTALQKKLQIPLLDAPYRVVCTRPLEKFEEESQYYLQLRGIEEQTVFLVRNDYLTKLIDHEMEQECYGISGEYAGLDTLHLAYQEARQSRIRAFIRCRDPRIEQEQKDMRGANQQTIESGFAERFVQQFGTEQMTKSMNQFQNIYFEGQMGKIDANEVFELGRTVWKELYEIYTKVIDMNISDYARLRQPLNYRNAKEYIKEYVEWLTQLKQILDVEFDDYRNKEKIHQAITYIQEHYDHNLNMAVVSNHVSMNYSLFSVTFKQYTGQNFVNYIKGIRLEKARELLVQTEEKIIDISRMVGYDNEKHFMKLFKNAYGVSPTEYRKNLQTSTS